MSMNGVHCKAHNNNSIRRFLLKEPQMNHLQSTLDRVFNLHNNFHIMYQNEKGDLIEITSDGDLEVAMKKGGLLRLYVVGDEASVAVSVVERDEELNLGKKDQRCDEFLGGNGRKFARREKGEKKCGGRRKRRYEGKYESNEPLSVCTPQVEAAPVTDVSMKHVPMTHVPKEVLIELKSKFHAQKSKVLNIKLQIRNLKQHESTPKEKMEEMKILLTQQKEELNTIRAQLKELRIQNRQIRISLQESSGKIRRNSRALKRKARALKRKERRERRKAMRKMRRDRKKIRLSKRRTGRRCHKRGQMKDESNERCEKHDNYVVKVTI